MKWKARIRYTIPPSMLNSILLQFPFLYRTKLVYYETHLQADHGIDDLLTQLNLVIDIPGNIIECGSALCGTSIVMANYLHSKEVHKIVYSCDSFEGYDPAELDKERQAGLTLAQNSSVTLASSYDYVKRKIEKLGVGDIVFPVRGFFKDTLSDIESDFSLALIDCNLKESTIYCAETIWSKIVRNGRLLFDDYTYEEFQGARLGVESFLSKHEREISEHGLLNRLYYVCKA